MAKKQITKKAKNSTTSAPKAEKKVPGKPFPKGVSGNPAGRPVGQRDYATIYKEALKKLAEAKGKTPEELEEIIQQVGITKAMLGDYRFYQDLHDRMYGKPTQRTEITGKDGKDLIPDSDSKRASDEAINELLNGKNSRHTSKR